MDDIPIKNNISVEISYNVKKQETLYIDNNQSTAEIFIDTVKVEDYSEVENNDIQFLAA